MVDVMKPFVKTTYDLEGDGPLVLYAYQKISSLYANITLAHHPNVLAVADDLAQGSASHKMQLINYANTCYFVYKWSYSYFKEKFNTDLKKAEVFKAARYFLPCKIDELRPTISDIDSLKSFPFLHSTLLADLKAELAEAAEGVVETVNPLESERREQFFAEMGSGIQASITCTLPNFSFFTMYICMIFVLCMMESSPLGQEI